MHWNKILEAADVKQNCGSLSFLNDANPPSGGFPGERQTCFKPELTCQISAIVCKKILRKWKIDGDAFTVVHEIAIIVQKASKLKNK